MTGFDLFKAQFLVRLRWFGWAVGLTFAGLFVFFNPNRITIDLIFMKMEAPGALTFAGLFLLGWYAGEIFQFTATQVKAIEQKYRERMTMHGSQAVPAVQSATSAPAAGESTAAAPAPAPAPDAAPAAAPPVEAPKSEAPR